MMMTFKVRVIILFSMLLCPFQLDFVNAALVPVTKPRPAIRGYSAVDGICDIKSGTLAGQSFSGINGTLKQCAKRCSDTGSCVGFNFFTDQSKCQLFGVECANTLTIVAPDPNQNFYVKGEIACSRSTKGDKYYIAFMANRVSIPKFPPLEIWTTQDKISAGFSATLQGHSSMPLNAQPSSSFQVPYKKAAMVGIPPIWRVTDIFDNGVSIEKKGLKLSASEEFVFYGVNKENYTTDAFLGVPSRSLGTRYYASCHWPANWNCEFAITPTEDSTTVTITLPRIPTRNVGNWPATRPPTGYTVCAVPYNGRIYTNGESFTIRLNEFDVAQIQDPCDLTGTLIVADKPVAVWSGDSRANVGPSLSRDHLVEQLFPTDSWGSDCAAWPTPRRAAGLVDYWVITAANDGTRVRVDSDTNRTVVNYDLNAGESVRFPANSVTEWMRFSSDANKPFQAVKYTHSATDMTIPGDPSMILCIPSAQFGYGYTFITPVGVASNYTSYLSIIATQGAQAGFSLNGVNLTGITWSNVPNSDLIGGFMQLSGNTQQFRIDHAIRGTTFEAYIYGSGNRESFGFPTGSCIKVIGPCSPSNMVAGDGKDNDCDGVIDEEACGDGIDNDYDGKTDEDCYSAECTCCPKICPDIPQIEGGYTIANNIRQGSTVQYKCLNGARLRGQDTITCGPDGRWSGPPPTCEKACDCCPKICPDIPQIDHGYTIATNIRSGSTVNYKCLNGYSLKGSQDVITCTNNGTWTGPVPTCEVSCPCCPTICPDIPQIVGGYTVASNIKQGSTVSYKCLGNRRLVGQDTLMCGNNGQWSSQPPRCQ